MSHPHSWQPNELAENVNKSAQQQRWQHSCHIKDMSRRMLIGVSVTLILMKRQSTLIYKLCVSFTHFAYCKYSLFVKKTTKLNWKYFLFHFTSKDAHTKWTCHNFLTASQRRVEKNEVLRSSCRVFKLLFLHYLVNIIMFMRLMLFLMKIL